MGTYLLVFAVVLTLLAVCIAVMAIGVMFQRRCLRGSCGGPAVIGPDGQKLSCGSCPNRSADTR